jgi:hypothetical protein
VCRVDWPQDVVAGNLPVKRRDQALESFIADGGMNFLLVH